MWFLNLRRSEAVSVFSLQKISHTVLNQVLVYPHLGAQRDNAFVTAGVAEHVSVSQQNTEVLIIFDITIQIDIYFRYKISFQKFKLVPDLVLNAIEVNCGNVDTLGLGSCELNLESLVDYSVVLFKQDHS